MGHTPLDKDFRDFHCAIKCLLVIPRHHSATTLELSTALRRRIRPHESIRPLPKDADVPLVDIRRRHLLRGQLAQNAFQLFDEAGGVFGDRDVLGVWPQLLGRRVRWEMGE